MSKKKPAVAKQIFCELHLTEHAIDNLLAIESYSIEQWGKRVANKYLSNIEGRLKLIQENPNLLSSFEGLPEVLKCYPAGKHLLIFDTQPESLVLLTVIHSSMDLPARLAELVPALVAEIDLLHSNYIQKGREVKKRPPY